MPPRRYREGIYREGMDAVPGHTAAARHLNRYSGNHRAAWAGLDIFDLDTADEYLFEPARAALRKVGSDEEKVDAVIEVAEMFALTAVMADRERREKEQEDQTHVKRSKEDSRGDDSADCEAG